MKIMHSRFFLLALLFLLTSCADKPKESQEHMAKLDNLEKATDEQISGVAVGHPLLEVQKILRLERYKYNIAANGAFGFPTYRYFVEKRVLFFETNPSGKITRAFFADREDSKHEAPQESFYSSGRVVKPK